MRRICGVAILLLAMVALSTSQESGLTGVTGGGGQTATGGVVSSEAAQNGAEATGRSSSTNSTKQCPVASAVACILTGNAISKRCAAIVSAYYAPDGPRSPARSSHPPSVWAAHLDNLQPPYFGVHLLPPTAFTPAKRDEIEGDHAGEDSGAGNSSTKEEGRRNGEAIGEGDAAGQGGNEESMSTDVGNSTGEGGNEEDEEPKRWLLVSFFAPHCHFSRQAFPRLALLAHAFYPEVSIAAFDSWSNASLNSAFGIRGFPMMLLFHGKSEAARFHGSPSELVDIARWIERVTGLNAVEDVESMDEGLRWWLTHPDNANAVRPKVWDDPYAVLATAVVTTWLVTRVASRVGGALARMQSQHRRLLVEGTGCVGLVCCTLFAKQISSLVSNPPDIIVAPFS